jgi:hypothetical protein
MIVPAASARNDSDANLIYEPARHYDLAVPSIDQIAAVFTIVAGTFALIQLTVILLRLNRRPRLTVRIGEVRDVSEDGRRIYALQLITTNSGSLSARNILWNYDLPATFRVLGSDAEHHARLDRVTVARALEQLHPRVETHHELTIEIPRDAADFELRYRIHLEDARPQIGFVRVNLGGGEGRRTPRASG